MGRISGWHYDDKVDFALLLGKTLAKIEGADKDSDDIIFETVDGERFGMYHNQYCCEGVNVEEVVGDIADLIGEPILEAEEVSHSGGECEPNPEAPKPREYSESWTWTFYKIGTRKGSVTLRWLGESNGYYSERVDFIKLQPHAEGGE
jgi:hypothetical protein